MKIVASLVLFALLGACTATSTSPASSAQSMPPFTKEFAKDARNLYHLTWLKDGYPGGRKDDGSIYAHPLYGVYVLNDYYAQYTARPSARLKRAIRRVAYAALGRMREHEGSLVFWYEANPDFSRAYKRHYSGLTQSYYAIALYQAGEVLKDHHLIREADRAFDALLVPVAKDGVLYKDVHGTSVAEVPQEPNSYILNGWISALYSVKKYAKLSGSKKAAELVDESARAMTRLLPLYDLPDLANSRYGLSGFVEVRLVSGDSHLKLRNVRVTVPGEGSFDSLHRRSASRWQNYLMSDTEANLVISRASFPEPNALQLTVDSDAIGTAELQAFVSNHYNPRYSAPTDETWVPVTKLKVAKGHQTLTASLPWKTFELVAYPTDFGRKVDGHNMNFYHAIHITQLKALAEATGVSAFASWSNKWQGYMCRWKDLAVYDGLWASTPDGRRVPVAQICD